MNAPEIGNSRQYRALRDFLVRTDYTEGRICEELGLPPTEAFDIATLSDILMETVAGPEPLNTLIRLSLLGEYISISEAESQFTVRRGRP